MSSHHTNYIRMNDYCVVWKQLRGEWIPNFDEGKIYSAKLSRYLKAQRDKNGYYYLRIQIFPGTFRNIYLHRALWILKNGIPYDSKLEVDHINHNPADNRIQNLRLVTPAENSRNRPEQFARAEAIRREKAAGATTAELSRKYNYSQSMIRDIVSCYRYDPRRYPGTKATPHLHVMPYGDQITGWRK